MKSNILPYRPKQTDQDMGLVWKIRDLRRSNELLRTVAAMEAALLILAFIFLVVR